MLDIIPAILPKDYEEMKNKISLVRGIAPIVQIDFCDGIFVQNVSWPFLSARKRSDLGNSKRSSLKEADLDQHFKIILNEEEGMPFWQDIDFEFDLMTADAVENFDSYCKLGPKRIIFHLEAVGNLEEFKNFLEGMDVYVRDAVEIGVAINTATPAEKIFPLVNYVDFVQCMGIEKIGFQGQKFDERVLEQIKKLKEKFPDLIISADGGVNLATAPKLARVGANRLAAGSAIFNSTDIRETIRDLENAL